MNLEGGDREANLSLSLCNNWYITSRASQSQSNSRVSLSPTLVLSVSWECFAVGESCLSHYLPLPNRLTEKLRRRNIEGLKFSQQGRVGELGLEPYHMAPAYPRATQYCSHGQDRHTAELPKAGVVAELLQDTLKQYGKQQQKRPLKISWDWHSQSRWPQNVLCFILMASLYLQFCKMPSCHHASGARAPSKVHVRLEKLSKACSGKIPTHSWYSFPRISPFFSLPKSWISPFSHPVSPANQNPASLF